MSLSIRLLIAATAIATSASALADAAPSPYAGQQSRSIKALSDSDVAGLLAGSGAGFAKAAELNGYPGPAHVLELADELRLDDAQRAATRELLSAHKARAQALGAGLVAAERDFDRIFAERRADPDTVDRAAQRVGGLQGQLRAEHLKTHLAQTALLSPEQARRYAALRGYAAPEPAGIDSGHSSKHH